MDIDYDNYIKPNKMKLNKNQLSVVVKSIIKEEIEKFKSLKEGSWQVITNDEGEPIGKDYVYGPEDPEYYETGDDYNDDRPRSRVGSSTGQKSDVINSIRDTLKRNDIYSKIVMSSGRSGRYISIPYGNSNLTINFVFKRGQGMKIEVGSRLFDDAYEAVDYLIKNSDKSMFKSQSEHESSLKAGAKDKRAQNVKDKEAKKAEQEKLEKLEKIKRIPAIASAIGEHGLYNKRDFKVLFGNTPSKVISATIQDILETMPYDELRKIVKITVDKPKYFSENKKTKKKQITISELKQIIRESINEVVLNESEQVTLQDIIDKKGIEGLKQTFENIKNRVGSIPLIFNPTKNKVSAKEIEENGEITVTWFDTRRFEEEFMSYSPNELSLDLETINLR